MLRGNLYECPNGDAIVKCGNIARLHSNAAVAGRTADALLLRRAMNVNATLKGMRVLRLESAQPDDTSDHRVAPGSIGLKNFPGQSPLVEDCAGGRVATNFFLDGEVTQRSCHSPPVIANPEHGGGHRVSRYFPAVLNKHQLLITYADDHLVRCIDRRESEDGRN